MVEDHREDPLASYQLAIHLRGLGAYYYSVLAASYVIRAANVGTLDAPAFIARMRYPAYYLDLVLAEADRYGFDPLLMLTLHIASAELLLVLVPFTWLSHMLLGPMIRAYAGSGFGSVRHTKDL